MKPTRGARVVTSDCYAILGVTPAAEDVVIGAAYRALMRHYHPDTNPDPKAQTRAQEISAAYAILRDPAKRAEYDADRGAGGILWAFDEPAEQAPPMRTAGIVTAVLAVVLVGAVWAWPRPSDSLGPAPSPIARQAHPKPAGAQPQRPTAPEAGVPPVRPPAPPPVSEPVADIEPVAAPPSPVRIANAEPMRPIPRPAPRSPPQTAAAPKPAAAKPAAAKPAAATADAKPTEPKPDAEERVATLTRMSAGFFSQSMVHATDAKKEMLLAVRDRSAAQRKACRSDSCVAEAYVRQIRETSAIMEDRGEPK